jgi:hypothetical protein
LAHAFEIRYPAISRLVTTSRWALEYLVAVAQIDEYAARFQVFWVGIAMHTNVFSGGQFGLYFVFFQENGVVASLRFFL